MCGIAGILRLDGTRALPAVLETMCMAIEHRGPDAGSTWSDGAVALGHQRLSILDLATGDQPLTNEDGSIWIVYNGEVYNYADIRRELLARGHTFRTRSDTETIVHAYEEYGPECVKRLRGMFAFALWDANKNCLLLARDRVGKKPLFYAITADELIFGSELQALLEYPSLERAIDPSAVDEYLTYGYIAAPRTIYAGVRKLLPGHYMVVRPERAAEATAVRYWHPEYLPKLAISVEDAEERLFESLNEAVRLRMVADVPVGALLSGGIDSSLVVALMALQSSKKIQTFSIGFDEARYNELPFARMVAEKFETDHHEFVVKPNALQILPKLVRHYGEPFADSSSIPSYYVAQMTRSHVKVAMNGDGGDECMGGYERYAASLAAQRYSGLPDWLRLGVISRASTLIPDRLSPRNRLRQAKRFLQNADRPVGQRYTRWMSYFTPEQKSALYSPDMHALTRGGGRPEDWLAALVDRPMGDHLDRLLCADLESYLPYDLLVKMDIATMANSLEARSPFLDSEVLDFAARLPSSMKVRGTRLKWLSRRLARRFIPREAIDRRKMGFGVPVGDWLRAELKPLVHDLLLSNESLSRGLFAPDEVRRLAARHAVGHDHSYQLWALIWLEMWYREIHERPSRV